ncbi:MAG: transcription antitermination factor NusB [Myxococcota bacterium]
MKHKSRRLSRQWALQILCQAEARMLPLQQQTAVVSDTTADGLSPADKQQLHELTRLFFSHYSQTPQPDPYCLCLVDGVADLLFRIDEILTHMSQGWKLSRMACVDRNVLRIAVYEMLFGPKLPKQVVMNEAIEVARQFGTSGSAAFVNGVLDALAHRHLKPDNQGMR